MDIFTYGLNLKSYDLTCDHLGIFNIYSLECNRVKTLVSMCICEYKFFFFIIFFFLTNPIEYVDLLLYEVGSIS